jgi:hypothetical protein
MFHKCGPGSSAGIATNYRLDGPVIESRWDEIFRRPDRPWSPPSLQYSGYRVFPGGKVRPGRAAGHSPPYSAAVSWKSRAIPLPTLWATTGPVTGTLYLFIFHKSNPNTRERTPVDLSITVKNGFRFRMAITNSNTPIC